MFAKASKAISGALSRQGDGIHEAEVATTQTSPAQTTRTATPAATSAATTAAAAAAHRNRITGPQWLARTKHKEFMEKNKGLYAASPERKAKAEKRKEERKNKRKNKRTCTLSDVDSTYFSGTTIVFDTTAMDLEDFMLDLEDAVAGGAVKNLDTTDNPSKDERRMAVQSAISGVSTAFVNNPPYITVRDTEKDKWICPVNIHEIPFGDNDDPCQVRLSKITPEPEPEQGGGGRSYRRKTHKRSRTNKRKTQKRSRTNKRRTNKKSRTNKRKTQKRSRTNKRRTQKI